MVSDETRNAPSKTQGTLLGVGLFRLVEEGGPNWEMHFKAVLRQK